jgi:hypothetical protein
MSKRGNGYGSENRVNILKKVKVGKNWNLYPAVGSSLPAAKLKPGQGQVCKKCYRMISAEPVEDPSEVQWTSTNMSETSSEGGPLRHAATLSRIPCFIWLKGRSAASRTNSLMPATPNISSRELNTSVIPSV